MWNLRFCEICPLICAVLLCAAPLFADNAPVHRIKVGIDPTSVIARIPSGFLGLGFESAAVAQPNFFSGKNEKMIRLYRNLSAHGLMRIGGNVSDHTVYDANGTAVAATERGVTIVNHQNLLDLADFARATGWTVMWGLNASTDTVDHGVVEAQAVNDALGDRLQSFEIGNEVQAHAQFGGKFDNYYTYYKGYKAALRAAIPNARLSGPDSIGGTDWVSQYAAGEGSDAKLLTCHYYRGGQGDPATTIEKLLRTDDGLTRTLQKLRAISNQSGVPYRMNEFNSFSGGGRAGVSDTFASALWALDVSYQLASNGSSGVNFETDLNQLGFISRYSPIVHDPSGRCDVRPEYYGLLAYSITGRGDVVATRVDNDDINLTAYATKAPSGALWLTVINKDLTGDADVSVTVPAGYTKAATYRLAAPSAGSLDQVTLGGSEVDNNGNWKPKTFEKAAITDGSAAIRLPHASAILVQISR